MGRGIARLDLSRVDHVFAIFMSGMCVSVSMLAMGYYAVRGRNFAYHRVGVSAPLSEN
jgi:hypothetical protein